MKILEYAPKETKYVYISTIMAFGMGSQNRIFKNYIWSHSVYGATKRYAEKLAIRKARETGREVYVLRLGQVHGEFQSVSRMIRTGLRDFTVHLPDVPSYTVFTFTIAEALVNIAMGFERPGIYTLLSNPEWSWKEVFEYYAKIEGVQPNIKIINGPVENKLYWKERLINNLTKYILAPLTSFFIRHREWLASYLLFRFPAIERRLKALYSLNNARNQLAEECRNSEYYSPAIVFYGTLPGSRLKKLSDSRITMGDYNAKLIRYLQERGLRKEEENFHFNHESLIRLCKSK